MSYHLLLLATDRIGRKTTKNIIKLLLTAFAFLGLIQLTSFSTAYPIPPFNLSQSVNILFQILALSYLLALFLKSQKIKLPAPLLILFLNYFLVTLSTLGLSRFIKVIDFIFILVACKYVVSISIHLVGLIYKSIQNNQWQKQLD